MAFSSLSLHFQCFNDAGMSNGVAMNAAQHKTAQLLKTFSFLISLR